MKLGVSSGTRYYRVGEQYYTPTSYHADMWKECLEVFDEVIIADRVIHSDKIEAGFKPTVIEGVKVIDYPNYEGPWSLLKNLPKMLWRAKKAVREADVWHFHCVHFETFCTWLWARFYGIPYTLELRGDQDWDLVYLNLRGVKLPRLVALVIRSILWLQLTRPLAVIGVSKSLTEDFPPHNNCPKYTASNARIPSKLYRKPRTWENDSACRTILCLGRLEAQKNPIGTMKALARLDEKGFKNWKLVWVGEGPVKLKEEILQLTDKLGLSDRVKLLGFVPWEDVFEILNTADLFLLNSVAEGLPRAMVEGMASALPAISTDVRGVSELLAPEDVVPRIEDDILADKLYEVLTNPERLTEMSRRNLKTSKAFSMEILRARKVEFYSKVKMLAANFNKRKNSSNQD